MSMCSVSECGRVYHAKGFCQRHYRQIQRHGSISPEAPGRFHPAVREKVARQKQESLRDKLLQHCSGDGDPERCWVWQGKGTNTLHRRGLTTINKHQISVHRAMYFLDHPDQLRKNMIITQTCGHSLCINPFHLKVGRHSDCVPILKRNRQKQWCLHGHRFTAENIYWSKGTRLCRQCRHERAAQYARVHRKRGQPDINKWDWQQVSARFHQGFIKIGQCWVWQGKETQARMRIHGWRFGVHRVGWELAGRVVPPNMVLQRQCDTANCVNPAHFQLGPQVAQRKRNP